MADVKYIGKNILNHDLILNRGNVSGSAVSTGSFGRIEVNAISASIYEGLSSDTVGLGQKFKHTQGSANITWSITHDMGFQYPNINVYDNNDKLVIPTEVTATSSNVLTIAFDSPVAGTAILSTGGSRTAGGQNYNHTQGSANTTWTVSHNLEYQYPAVTVYDGNSDVIIPQRIRATNANTLTLTFTSAESGYAHVSVGGGLPYVTATNSGKYLRVKDDASGVQWAVSQFSGSTQFTGSAGITGSLDVTGTATFGSLSDGTITIADFKDEDNMASNSATSLSTQQSIKAYVDSQIATEDTLAELNDTNITTPADASLLLYDTGTSTWRDGAMSGDATISDTGAITLSATNTNLTTLANVTSLGTIASFRSTGIDDNADALAITISSAENVGIGTASPLQKLHVDGNVVAECDSVEWKSNDGDYSFTFAPAQNNSGFHKIYNNYSGGGDNRPIIIGTYGYQSNQLFLDTNGRIGIGTAAPAKVLHIYQANDGGDTTLLIQNADAGNSSDETSVLRFTHTLSGADGGKIVSGRDGLYTSAGSWANADSFMAFYTSLNNTDAEYMRITSAGNVGIGTTSPASTQGYEGKVLEIGGNEPVLKLRKDDDNDFEIIASSGKLLFRTEGNNPALRMAIVQSSGNVGIGSDTSPDYLLDVQGTFRADGAASFGGSVTATTFTGNVSGNAATVTTNANLTGDVTSTGNATAIAAGVIINADVKSDAAIAYSKLGSIPTWNQSTTGNAATATKIASITNSNIVQLTTTQTLTNKTLTSPTLTTPALGTPSALVLTNATALPAAQVAQGTMASGMVLVAPALGTPASGVATNLTGTAASLTAGTVTSIGNLTGVVTSTNRATAIADNAISGDKIDGGTISSFRSTGIDDNADALAVTITSAERVGIGVTDPAEILETKISGTNGANFIGSNADDDWIRLINFDRTNAGTLLGISKDGMSGLSIGSNGKGVILTYTNKPLYFGTNDTLALTLDTSQNATFAGDVIVTGGLTINGTTTTINSTTLSVDDKNIELGSVATPSDTTANLGGITLKGATDKTILWTNSTDTWDFNQGIKVTSGNSTFAGTINSGAITSTAGISGTTGTFTGDVTIASRLVTSANIQFRTGNGEVYFYRNNHNMFQIGGGGAITGYDSGNSSTNYDLYMGNPAKDKKIFIQGRKGGSIITMQTFDSATGNVGIGTASPTYAFTVNSDNSTDGNVGDFAGSTNGGFVGIRVANLYSATDSLDETCGIQFKLGGGDATIKAYKVSDTQTGANRDVGLKFYTDDSNAMQLALTLAHDTSATFAGSLQAGNSTFADITADAATFAGNVEVSKSSQPHLQIQQTSGNAWRWYTNGTDSFIRNATGGHNILSLEADGDVGFYNSDGSATPFFWDASAMSLGIGETSPDEMLHLTSGTSGKPVLKIENTNANAGGAAIKLVKSTTSEGDGDELGDISWSGMDDADNLTEYAFIRGISADVSNNSEDGTLNFYTRVNGSSSERLSIVDGNATFSGTVTATTFIGALTGTASTVNISSDFSGTYPVLVDVGSNAIYNNPSLTYNGTSDTLTSPNFAGGNATFTGDVTAVKGTFTGSVVASIADNSAGQFTRTTASATTGLGDPLYCKFQTGGDMADGFASCITFAVQDSAATANLGFIGAVRAGADNTGDLIFHTYAAGSQSEKLRISSAGNATFGGAINSGAITSTAGIIATTGTFSGAMDFNSTSHFGVANLGASAIFVHGAAGHYGMVLEGGSAGNTSFGLKIQAGWVNGSDYPLMVRNYQGNLCFSVDGKGRTVVNDILTVGNNVAIGGGSPNTTNQLMHIKGAAGTDKYAALIENTSSDGFGVYIHAASGTRSALKVRDYTVGTDLFTVQGNGNATFAGKILQKSAGDQLQLESSAAGQDVRLRFLESGTSDSYIMLDASEDWFGFSDNGANPALGINTANGKVGIGTASPFSGHSGISTGTKLHIYGGSVGDSDIGDNPLILLENRAGAVGNRFGINFRMHGGTIYGMAEIGVVQENAGNQESGGIYFATKRDVTGTSRPIEAMRIDDSGKVGINTQTPFDPLSVFGTFRQQGIVNSVAESMAIWAQGGNTGRTDFFSYGLTNGTLGGFSFYGTSGTGTGDSLFFEIAPGTGIATFHKNATFAGDVTINGSDDSLKVVGGNAEMVLTASANDTCAISFEPDNANTSKQWRIFTHKDSPYKMYFQRTSSNTDVLTLDGTNGNATFAGTIATNGATPNPLYGVKSQTAGGDGSWGIMSTNLSQSGYQGGGAYLNCDNVGLSIGYGVFCGSAGATTNWALYAGGGNVYITNDMSIGGDIVPLVTNSKDLGSTTKRWANVYAGDLHLKNEVGDWTVEEGEDELFLHNNKTGKKFAIMMREIE